MFNKRIYFILYVVATLSVVTFGQKQLKIDLAKKITEATPQSLPQSPVTPRPSTDAGDKGLKNRVQRVVESSQEPGKAKGISDEYLFGTDGNYIMAVGYYEDYPRSVTVWGYLSGSRVCKSADVKYAPGEKPKPQHIEIREEVGSKPNSLFDLQFKYEYDGQNRLLADTSFNSQGQIWSRKIHSYSGNQIDNRDHDDHNEISRTVEILDKDGNVVEERGYGQEGISTIHFLTYEFDSHGNWIVQKTYEAKGKIGRKLLWTTFRTITYYPQS